jgi:hypothetical protein
MDLAKNEKTEKNGRVPGGKLSQEDMFRENLICNVVGPRNGQLKLDIWEKNQARDEVDKTKL